MRRSATIRVDNDFTTSQAAVALRAADHEASGRIDQVTRVLQPFLWHHRFDDRFDYRFLDLFVLDIGRMLRRQHNSIDCHRATIDILQCHLRFGIWTQPWQATILAQLRLALDDAVRIVDCSWHQFRSLVARITEHQALVAGALIEIQSTTFIDPLCNIR